MGASFSREERKKRIERKNKAFLPKKIYYDEDGNLRHDWDRVPRNKNAELTKLMQEETAMEESEAAEVEAEKKEESDVRATGAAAALAVSAETPQKLFYVVSSPWVNAWVAFAFASKTSPDPGPCCNDTLLLRDESNNCFVPKDALTLTRKARKGDYRHVTEGMWKQICNLYPGSGPSIKDPSHISDGQYDTSGWEIDQSGFKPAEEKQWRKKKAKKVVEKKEEVAREKPVLTDDIELTMDDALYQVDPRAASVLGGSGSSSVVYENPMKKKKEFHGPSDGKGSVPPSHEVCRVIPPVEKMPSLGAKDLHRLHPPPVHAPRSA